MTKTSVLRFASKPYITLLAACIFSVVLVIPYLITLLQAQLEKNAVPIPLFIGLQLVQAVIMFGLIIWAGLKIAPKVNLGLPFLTGYFSGAFNRAAWRQTVKTAVLLGVVTSLIVIGLDQLFAQFLPAIQAPAEPPAWQGLLASFYGGISEEVLVRLFLMSMIIWGVVRVFKYETIPDRAYWTGIFLAALLFGAGHLPAAAALAPLTPLFVTRIVLLNAIFGVLCGWLFWKKGFEAAVLAHFSGDLVLHVIQPLLSS